MTGDDPLSFYTKGLEYERTGDLTVALRFYNLALERDPEYLDAWTRRRIVLIKMRDFTEAESCVPYIERLQGQKKMRDIPLHVRLLPRHVVEEGKKIWKSSGGR